MSKFLSIPVTDKQNYIVPVDGIALIEQASTTTVTITYKSGLVLTATHATAGAGVETQKDYIQDQVLKASEYDFKPNKIQLSDLPFAVSGIVPTLLVQATS